ncbi:MAG TPA: dihydrofolate reductase family protein [Myxococcota bacterium]|nr:dihydrofolate reductase family protein [Myxococcota bacterium]
MSKVRVNAFTISLDGYGAGSSQTLDKPMGERGEQLHGWMVTTRTFHTMFGGRDEGTTGVDDDFAKRSMAGLGAWILGRNMFGPVRGPWPDESWQGWWGEEPPYHVPVFVLTHHARKSFEMKGGTTFHFVTGGPDEAMRRAKEAAGAKDIRVGGGVATVRYYLEAGAIDELHLVVSPVVLGKGEHLLRGIDLPKLGYRVSEHAATEKATHVVFTRS